MKAIDERRNLICPGDLDATISYTAEHLATLASKYIKEKGSFHFALSGGSSPMTLFQYFTKTYKSILEWDKMHLYFVDERAVPIEDEQNNYTNIMSAGFDRVGLLENHVYRMQAETDIASHALSYEELLKKNLHNGSIDFIMLGMGPDGHTASLFPGTKALEEQKRWVIENEVPQKNMWRMTMTFPFINNAKHILFYCVGEGKTAMLKEILIDDNTSYPASRIGTPSSQALWIVDSAANPTP